MPSSRQRGFTLIELVAAFVIFAIGFGILLQILTVCLRTTTQSADYTRAALWAQSLLDVQGVGEPLQEGSDSGQFDDKYHWQLQVTKLPPPQEPQPAVAAAGNANAAGPNITTLGNNIDLYQLELVVSWGSFYLTHNASFVTLRAQDANAGNGNPGNGFVPGAPPARGRQ
jgi:general secretion pathway protein I